MDVKQTDIETETTGTTTTLARGSPTPGDCVTAGLLVVCVLAVLFAGLTVAIAPASAGDTVALFYFEPSDVEADPGETVTVDVVMRTHGGYSGEGIGHVELGVDYDPDVLTVTDIDRGPYLEGDDDTELEVETAIDETNGTAAISQHREPAGDGTTGTESVATVTLAVADDAQPTNATLTIVGSRTTLVTEVQQSTMVREATVVVDGGSESAESDDGPDGVILADDPDETGEANSESETADLIPGFGVSAAIGGIVATLLVRQYVANRP